MLRIVSLLLTLLLFACASTDEDNQTQEQMYNSAMQDLASAHYDTAIKLFNKLEARYPYSVYATQAILESGYAHYKSAERAEALAQADRFIQLHPTHPNVDYAYYLKGLANESLAANGFAELLHQDITERDPESEKAAFASYKELVRRFPQSIYVNDSVRRMRQLSDALATADLHAARFYLDRGAPLAAVNRAKAMLLNFPDSPQREDALDIMAVGYTDLGETALSADARRVLRQNYPQSRFLADAGSHLPPKPSWFSFWE